MIASLAWAYVDTSTRIPNLKFFLFFFFKPTPLLVSSCCCKALQNSGGGKETLLEVSSGRGCVLSQTSLRFLAASGPLCPRPEYDITVEIWANMAARLYLYVAPNGPWDRGTGVVRPLASYNHSLSGQLSIKVSMMRCQGGEVRKRKKLSMICEAKFSIC